MLRLILILLVSYAYAHSDTLEVQIEQGKVIGHREGEVFSFMNIPYATAPTGKYKFKAPLRPPTWTVLDAVNRNITCLQPDIDGVQEDCLVANIFVPDTNATNLPVLVEVHGGGYYYGIGNYAGFKELVSSKELIVVNFNYRIGVFGFLCLGTKDIPGNAGMKDQVALLRWVKRNIASFGGNPNDVTIGGCSAGGASIDLLTLSPMTKGLFNKAISESGASLGILGAVMDPLENAKIYARSFNFTNVDDISALENFYKTLPIDLILNNYDILTQNSSNFLFTPCVEPLHDGDEEKFLSEAPWYIIRNRKYEPVPLIRGYTDLDGDVRMDYFEDTENMLEQFYDYLPGDLHFETEEERREQAEIVKKAYFGEEPNRDLRSFIGYYTDTFFVYPTLRSIRQRKQAYNDTIYLLEYTFNRENSNIDYPLEGASHCSQHNAVLDEDTTNDTPSYLEKKRFMRELYLNFITTGIPSATGLPRWPVVTESLSPYLAIKEVSEVLDTFTYQDRIEMWDRIYSKYARHPKPPQ